MAERTEGWYWVKYNDRLVSFGATKEWLPLYWYGDRFEDKHYFLEHQNIGQVGSRIPSPDEPWQCVPTLLPNEMVRAFSIDATGEWDDAPDDQKIEVAERLQSAFEAMLSVSPKLEDV